MAHCSTEAGKHTSTTADCSAAAPGVNLNHEFRELASMPRIFAEEPDSSPSSPLPVDEQATLPLTTQSLKHQLDNHLLTSEPENAVCGSANYTGQRNNTPERGSGKSLKSCSQVTIRAPTANRYGELSGIPRAELLIFTMESSSNTPQDNEEGGEPCVSEVGPGLLPDSSASGFSIESTETPPVVQRVEVTGSVTTPETEIGQPGPEFGRSQKPIRSSASGTNAVCGSTHYAGHRDSIEKRAAAESIKNLVEVVDCLFIPRHQERSGLSRPEPLIFAMESFPETTEDSDEQGEPRVSEVDPGLLADSLAKGCSTDEFLGDPFSVQPPAVRDSVSSVTTPAREIDDPGPQFAASQDPILAYMFGMYPDASAERSGRELPALPFKPAEARPWSAACGNVASEDRASGMDSSSSLEASKSITVAGSDSASRRSSSGTKEMGVAPKTAALVKQTRTKEKAGSGLGGLFSDGLRVKRVNTTKKAPTPPLESFHQVSIKVHLPCQLDQKLLRAVVQMMPQQQELEISSIHFPYTFSVRIPPSILECLCRGGDEGDDKTREDPRRNTGGVTALRIVVYGHSPQTLAAKTIGLTRPRSSSNQEDSSTGAAQEKDEVKGLKCRRAPSRTASPTIPKQSTGVPRGGIPIGYVDVPLRALLARGDSTGHGITWLAFTKVGTTRPAPLTHSQLDYYNDAFNRAANTGMEFLRPKVAISFKLLTPEGTPISGPVFEGRSPLKRLYQVEKELEQIYIQADLEIQRYKAALKEAKENKKGVKAYLRDVDSPEFAVLEKECQRLKRELRISEEGAKAGFATREETIRRLQHDLRTARLLIRSDKRRPKAPDRRFPPGVSGQTTDDEMEGQDGDGDSAPKRVPAFAGPEKTRTSASVSWEVRRLEKRIIELEEANQEVQKQLGETVKRKNSLEAELKAVRDQLSLEKSKSKVQRQTIAALHALKPQLREASRRTSSTGSESREPTAKEVSWPKGLRKTLPNGHSSLAALHGECCAHPCGAQTCQQRLLPSDRLSMGHPLNGSTFEGAGHRRPVTSLNHLTQLGTPGPPGRPDGAGMLKGLSLKDTDVLNTATVSVGDNSLPALRSALGVPLADTQANLCRGVGGHLRSTEPITTKDHSVEVCRQSKSPEPEIATIDQCVHALQSGDQERCEGPVEETRIQEIRVASGVTKVEACVFSGTAYSSVKGSGFTTDLPGNAPHSEQTESCFFSHENRDVCRSLARVSDSLCYSESDSSPRSFMSSASCLSRGQQGLPDNHSLAGGMTALPSSIREESADHSPFSQLVESPRSPGREQEEKQRESPITEMLIDAAADKFNPDKSFTALLNGMADAADAAAASAAEAVERLKSGPAGCVTEQSVLPEADCGVHHRSFPGGGVFKKHPSVPRLILPDSLVSGGERFTVPVYDPYEDLHSDTSTDGASLSECSGAVPDQDHDQEGHLKSAVEETSHKREKDFKKWDHSQRVDGLTTPCETKGMSILKGNKPCSFPVPRRYPPLPCQYEVSTMVFAHNGVEICCSSSEECLEASGPESPSLLYPGAVTALEKGALAPPHSGIAEARTRVSFPMSGNVRAGSLPLPAFPTIVAGRNVGGRKDGLARVRGSSPFDASPVATPQKRATDINDNRTPGAVALSQKGTGMVDRAKKPLNFVLNNIRSAGIPRKSRLTAPLRHRGEREGHPSLVRRGGNPDADGEKKNFVNEVKNYCLGARESVGTKLSNQPKRTAPTNSSGEVSRSPTKKNCSHQAPRGSGHSLCCGEMTGRPMDRTARLRSSSPLRRVAEAARAAREASCRAGKLKKEPKCPTDQTSSPKQGTMLPKRDGGAVRRGTHSNFSSDASSAKASEEKGLGRRTSIHKRPQYSHGRLGLPEESVATADPPNSSVKLPEPPSSPGGRVVVVDTVAVASVGPPPSRYGTKCLGQRGGESQVTKKTGPASHTPPSIVGGNHQLSSCQSGPSSPKCPFRATSAGEKRLGDSTDISVATADLNCQLHEELDEECSTIRPCGMDTDLIVERQAALIPSGTVTPVAKHVTNDMVKQSTLSDAALKRGEPRARPREFPCRKVAACYKSTGNVPSCPPLVMMQQLASSGGGTALGQHPKTALPSQQSVNKERYSSELPLQRYDVTAKSQGREHGKQAALPGVQGGPLQGSVTTLDYRRQVERYSEVVNVVPSLWSWQTGDAHQESQLENQDQEEQARLEVVRRTQAPLLMRPPHVPAYPPGDLDYMANGARGLSNFSTPYIGPRLSFPSSERQHPTSTVWLCPSDMSNAEKGTTPFTGLSNTPGRLSTEFPCTRSFYGTGEEEGEGSWKTNTVSLKQLLQHCEQQRRKDDTDTALASHGGATSTPGRSTSPSSRGISDLSMMGNDILGTAPVEKCRAAVVDGVKHAQRCIPHSFQPASDTSISLAPFGVRDSSQNSAKGPTTTIVDSLPRHAMNTPMPMSAAPPVRVQPSYQTTIVRQAAEDAPEDTEPYSQ